MAENYKWSITGKKFLFWLIAGIGAGTLAGPTSELGQYVLSGVVSGSFGESETAKDALWIVFTGGLTALVAGVKNWLKKGIGLTSKFSWLACVGIGAALFGGY